MGTFKQITGIGFCDGCFGFTLWLKEFLIIPQTFIEQLDNRGEHKFFCLKCVHALKAEKNYGKRVQKMPEM